MKLALIYPEFSLGRKPHFHPGVGAVAAAARGAGHEVSLIHLAGPVSEQELLDAVEAEQPDLVGFNSNTHVFRHVRQMSRWLKAHSSRPIICGGVHATVDPEGVLRTPSIDMVCVGEGDQAIVELCDALERGDGESEIPGIWRRHNGELLPGPPRPAVEDLDSLPFADRTIFGGLEEHKNHTMMMVVSRGCPYRCAYCLGAKIQDLYPNQQRFVRVRSAEHVLEEIEQVLRVHPDTRFLTFLDSVFPPSRKWMRQFAPLYKKRIGLPFRCNARPNLVDEEMARLLYDTGCRRIHMGIEAGNVEMRNRVLKRSISRQQIKRAFAACKAVGITTQSYNLLGVPFETPSTILDTVRLNAEAGPDVVIKSIFYPYPKTELHEVCVKHGFLTEKEYDTFLEGPVISQPSISQDQLVFAFEFFHAAVLLYGVASKLPAPLEAAFHRLMRAVFESRGVPHRRLGLAKRQAMTRTLPWIRRRFPGLRLQLRSRPQQLCGGLV